MPRSASVSLLISALICCTLCGCGDKTYPVEGRVLFKEDGTPLSGGWVEFELIDSARSISARGPIDDDGYFRLGTFRADDGALPGDYRALVVPPAPVGDPDSQRTPRSASVIHVRFLTYDTSGLTFTVAKKSNSFTIEVERPQRKK